jgi:hypothetical protein
MASGRITGRLAGTMAENEPTDGVWRIEQNRIQQWASTFQGKPLIVNGRLNGRDVGRLAGIAAGVVRCTGRGGADSDCTEDRGHGQMPMHDILLAASDGTPFVVRRSVAAPGPAGP